MATRAKLQDKEMVRLFKALSVETRLRIVQLLSKRTLCVGVLSNLLGVSAGAVSQHLRILRDAGLVEADRRGYFIHYYVTAGAAARCQAAMESIFESEKGTMRSAVERRSAKGRKNACAKGGLKHDQD